MIVDCAVYREGRRTQSPDVTGAGADLSAVVAAAHAPEAFAWVGLYEPTEAEMESVGSALGLHPLATEDAVRAHQRPKLERYADHHLFVVLKTLWYVDAEDAVETGQIAIFVGEHYVVTVRHGEGSGLSVTRRNLEGHHDMVGHGPYSVLYQVCDRVVDDYEVVAADLQTDVDEVELSVFSETPLGDSKRIYTLKREMAEVRRAVAPLMAPLNRLATQQVVGMPGETAAFFRDVADHVTRVHEEISSMDVLLSSAHDAYMSRIFTQQNNDMRKISAWVALAAVPTLLASIYGMNFDVMPELHWAWGYFGALGVMATACLVLFRLLKRSGWL